jgi:hypothetical protein
MGQCCPICVAGVSALCNKAQLVYQSDRKAMLEKYGMSGCMIDGDCRLVFESNACVSSCGVALPVSTAGFFETNIQGDANACDSACPPLLSPPCVPLTAVCSNGMCTAVSAPLR